MKEKGKMFIKGRAYEDIMMALMRNGYKVKVEAFSDKNPVEAVYKITYKVDEPPCDLPFEF